MSDYIRAKGVMAFGTRLRRLSENLDRQVQAIYRAHDSAFEPRWFPLIVALGEKGPLSVGELADLLGITHAAVSQMRGQLIAASLIREKPDTADRRRQMLALSAQGRRTLTALAPLWDAIARATAELVTKESPGLLDRLARVEDALAAQPMKDRVAAVMAAPQREKRHA